MNAEEVLAAYVADVAVRLPRRRRADVAFELRALLAEQLQDHADAAGRPADAGMALALVRGFGAPDDVAGRYRTPLTIVDPADGERFVLWSVVGLVLIWTAGLFAAFGGDDGLDVPTRLGRWWMGTAIPSLWWPGVLVVGFGLAARARRHAPPTSNWTPRAPDAVQGGRFGVALGVLGMAVGLGVLMEPRRVLDFFWDGRAAPAAYAALTYTDGFLRLRGPVLFALVATNIPLSLAVLFSGRRHALLRKIESVLAVALCAAMAWAIASGPIFVSPHADRTAKGLLALIVLAIAIGAAFRRYRSVRPAPQHAPTH